MLPAIHGTKSLIEAAKTEPRIKRIVLLSTFGAVIDLTQGFRPGYTYTGADWNPITYEQGKAASVPLVSYCAGKTIAERAAWACIEKERPHFDLVAFCAPMVLGPVVHPIARVASLNESNIEMWDAITGPGEEILMPDGPAQVDVRDFAVACVEALMREEVGNRRYTIAAPGVFTFQMAADIARRKLEWAKDVVKKGKEGEPVPNVFTVDGTQVTKDLGVIFTPVEETVIDTLNQIREIQLRESQ